MGCPVWPVRLTCIGGERAQRAQATSLTSPSLQGREQGLWLQTWGRQACCGGGGSAVHVALIGHTLMLADVFNTQWGL